MTYNIWEGDAPNPYEMRALLKVGSNAVNTDGMHIVKTFEVDTDEEAAAVFDEYSKDMRSG